ncbi:MAG: transcription termination/antitermination protein NusG [Planctomycetota bacterium]|nr:transcription termination/antitermination protein NusG [Planctomycetota bacterium]
MEPSEVQNVGSDNKLTWYVLKVQTNRENSIRKSLERRILRDGLDEHFGQIIIPTEKIVETKGGKKKVREQKLYPGYIMIQMLLNDETWYLVRDTSGVGDFTGAAGKPHPMDDDEVERMLGLEQQKEDEPTKLKIEFRVGDVVKITTGPFETFEGEIDAIDETTGKVSVLIEIFGRPTPVELEYHEVERP